MSASLELLPAAEPEQKLERAIDVEQYFTVNCTCGTKGRVYLRHWEKVRCSDCGKVWWALRPKKNGPMVLYPWPGDYVTVTNHEKFHQRLEDSGSVEKFMVDYFNRLGLGVVWLKDPSLKSPTRAESRRYVDHGDIGFRDKVIEIKHQLGPKKMFTGRHDWFVKSGDFFVCDERRFLPNSLCYYILNPPVTHAGVVMSSTKHLWTVKRDVRDHDYKDYTCNYWNAPLDCVQWLDLTKDQLHTPLYE